MRALRIFGSVLLVIAIAGIAGLLIPRPIWPEDDSAPETRRILVLTNPIHTDIAIPLDPNTRELFAFLGESGMPIGQPDARWLVFGWGGRAFYLETPTWSELKARPLLKALTIDASVLHIEVLSDIQEPHPQVSGFDLSEAEFGRLTAFIRSSFADETGNPALIAGAAYGSTDRFYEARGYFNALVGCNTWTAAALRQAGLRTGWWNPLPTSLAASLRLYNETEASPVDG